VDADLIKVEVLSMILDVRTMFIAMAVNCFIVAAGLFILQAGRVGRCAPMDPWLGFSGAHVLLAPITGDFVSIVVANTFLAASFCFFTRRSGVQGRPYNRVISLFHLQLRSCSFRISRYT
jgi:hypothetical protein